MLESYRMELANTIMRILANQNKQLTSYELLDIVRNEGDNTLQLETIYRAVSFLRKEGAVECFVEMGLRSPAFTTVTITRDGHAKLYKNSDWPILKQIIGDTDNEENESQTPPIFLSYSTHNFDVVTKIKDQLQTMGLETFMALYDIPTSDDWKEDILRNLNGCEIFIAFLSPEYKTSDWTDQESGIAFIKNKLIITINIGCEAYGFISIGQSYKHLNVPETSYEILDTIIRKGLSPEIKEGLIQNFINSNSYRQADINSEIMKKIMPFTNEQLNEILGAYFDNSQINVPNKASSFVQDLINNNADQIDRNLLSLFRTFETARIEAERAR